MDEKFLEFWGNAFLSAARSKKMWEDMTNWMRKGFPDIETAQEGQTAAKSMEEMAALFQKLYGVNCFSEKPPDYKNLTSKAADDFQEAMKAYLTMMGVVPRSEYLNLVNRYEQLKEKCENQQETIKHLKLLLDENAPPEKKMMGHFQEMFKDQSDVFLKMMTGFARGMDMEPAESGQSGTAASSESGQTGSQGKAQTNFDKGEQRRDGHDETAKNV